MLCALHVEVVAAVEGAVSDGFHEWYAIARQTYLARHGIGVSCATAYIYNYVMGYFFVCPEKIRRFFAEFLLIFLIFAK